MNFLLYSFAFFDINWFLSLVCLCCVGGGDGRVGRGGGGVGRASSALLMMSGLALLCLVVAVSFLVSITSFLLSRFDVFIIVNFVLVFL